MALSKSVEESLKEAEASLRNALSYAARQEKPFVARAISCMICDIDGLIKTDELIDKLETRMNGDSGTWGTFFTEEE
jgi:hypothetical protein